MDFTERIIARIAKWEDEAEELWARGEDSEAATLEACLKDIKGDLINGHSWGAHTAMEVNVRQT